MTISYTPQELAPEGGVGVKEKIWSKPEGRSQTKPAPSPYAHLDVGHELLLLHSKISTCFKESHTTQKHANQHPGENTSGPKNIFLKAQPGAVHGFG